MDGGEKSEDGVTGQVTRLVALRVARLLREGETILIVGDQPRSDTPVPDDSRRYSRIYPIGVRHTDSGPKVTGWRTEDGTILGMEDDLET